MNTLLLDPDAWDLTLDAQGNIALATNPYALAQNAASAIRLFLGEYWYDTTLGIPYFQQILGYFPPIELMRSYFVDAALTVPDVTAAQVFFTSFSEREVSGQVQVSDASGIVSVAGF